MFDWLSPISTEVEASLSTLMIRLVVAWVCGLAVASIARRGTAGGVGDSLSLTLVLMSILIAMATQIIGDNVARAFSLVGALSIVRFRTAVPATRDMAFVLAAVVVGMAAGAGQFWVCGLGTATVALATQWSVSTADQAGVANKLAPTVIQPNWCLTLQIGLHAAGGWEAELDRLTQSYQLLSAGTIRRGGALELTYHYLPRDGVDANQLIAALNALPVIESVAAKQLAG
jgi:hypothetical protein